MPVLHAVDGPLTGQRFAIPERPRLIVGRYEIYDVIIPDPSISRKHFALEARSDGLYLVDLGSLNGTLLNGRRVSTAKLEQGDRIAAGQTALYFDETDAECPPPEAYDVPPAEDHNGTGEPIEALDEGDIIEQGEGPEGAPAEAGPPATIVVPAAEGEAVAEVGEDDVIEVDEGAVEIVEEEEVDLDDLNADSVADSVEKAPPPKPRRKSPAKTRAIKVPSSGKPAGGRCAVCGKKIKEPDSGAARVKAGSVCGKCVQKFEESGEEGDLDKYVRDKQRRSRRRR